MTYRDDLMAALSRIDSLEREVESLRSEPQVIAVPDVPQPEQRQKIVADEPDPGAMEKLWAGLKAKLSNRAREELPIEKEVERLRADFFQGDATPDLTAIDDEEELQVGLHRALLWTVEEMMRNRGQPDSHRALVALAEAILARWDTPRALHHQVDTRWLDGVPLDGIRMPELRKLLAALHEFYRSRKYR